MLLGTHKHVMIVYDHNWGYVSFLQFAVDDTVRILDDIDRVRELQSGHGEWVDSMATVRCYCLCIILFLQRNIVHHARFFHYFTCGAYTYVIKGPALGN